MKCDQCAYLFINGVGCHETGCPAARTWTCRECGERYPRTIKVCLCMEPCDHNPGELVDAEDETQGAYCVECGEVILVGVN
jgi:hypothetical protein